MKPAVGSDRAFGAPHHSPDFSIARGPWLRDAQGMGAPPFPLRTERLLLRFVNESDVEALTAYRNDPAVAALQDWELPYPREKAHDLVRRHAGLTDFEPGRGHQVAIGRDGELVGDVFIGLDEHGGIAHLGYSLIPAAQGQGLAFEAVNALVADLVERVGVHRLVGEVSTDNLPSIRLLERLGMTFESLTERSFWWRGTWDDNLSYAMSAEQWRAWRDRPRTPPGDVRLVEITEHNRWTWARLRTHRSQERFCPAAHDCYADALFPGTRHGVPLIPVLRGIEADGEPAGLLMYSEATPFLWRLLVDRSHQGRGIGRRALTMWLDDMRVHGHRAIDTSWGQGKGGPEPLLLSMGFVPTGELDDGQVVARLGL